MVLSWRILSRVVLGVRSIRVFAKNMGEPYYEPTIMIHDSLMGSLEAID